MFNLFTFSVRSRLFLMINGFEKKFLLKDECSFCNRARKLDGLSEEIRCSEVGVSSIKKPSVDFEVGYKFSCFRIMHCWKFVCI